MNDDDSDGITRRDVLVGAAAGAAIGALAGCEPQAVSAAPGTRGAQSAPPSSEDAALGTFALGAPPWPTFDPFLFCVHHDDAYPAGNERLGPVASLAGRNIGRDFEGKDGWRMYHGDVVPGFPQHPHRGFETVTVVRRGFIDHSDSLGATARYGAGDVQWLTAGAGIQHAEMFPLVDTVQPNPLELFQIWLNLPSTDKFATPHFSMLWRESIPVHVASDAGGKRTTVTVVAGALGDARAPAPPPRSWASRAEADVALWTLALDPGARFVLPKAQQGTARTLYLFRGDTVQIGARTVPQGSGVRLRGEVAVTLVNGGRPSELLLLQGRPIGEPVAQHGPFVMNTRAEIEQAYADYRRTRFGGWPWPSYEPVHARAAGRFAIHADGREERAG
jgi:quercetin 2,3-dioxygenase